MFCSRCVLPFLVLHLVLEQISAAVIPNRSRTKREVDWLDQELLTLLSHPSDTGVLSEGDAGDVRRDMDELASQSETVPAPTADAPVQNQHQQQNQNQNQNQKSHNRRANGNRWKVARLDPIGRFQIPAFQKRKDKTIVYSED